MIQNFKIGTSIQICIFIISLTTNSFLGIAQNEAKEKTEIDHHCFYTEQTILPSIGMSAGFANSLIGGHGKLYYALNEKLCFGPEVTFSTNSRVKSTEIGVVAHYIFDLNHFGIYPVLGVGFLNEREIDHHFQGFGGITGLGIHRNIKKFTAYIETTAFFGKKYEQNLIVGIFYRIQLKK